MADGIAALIESDGEELDDDFIAVLEEARQQKQHFFATLESAQGGAKAISSPLPGSTRFGDYFDAAARDALEALAERAGVGDACRQRGLDGLLKIKSVRMSLGAALAYSHLQMTKGSILTTLHHPVSAAAVAETFVSDDTATRELVGHAPIDGFNVTGLPDFLKRLSSSE